MIQFEKGKFYEVYQLNGRGEKINIKKAECVSIDRNTHIATFKINGKKEIKYQIDVEKLTLSEVQKTELVDVEVAVELACIKNLKYKSSMGIIYANDIF